MDATGNLYIADAQNYRVRRVSPSGTITTVAGNGTQGYSGDGGAAMSAQLASPFGVATDNSSNLYIADDHNYRVRRVSPSGLITTFAGNGTQGYSGDGGLAVNAQMTPSAVAVDSHGNVYINDGASVRRVSTSGIITTIAGTGTPGYSGDGGPAINAHINTGYGLAIDSNDNIYVADIITSRIRKISSAGIITTIAGTGVPGYSGDGGLAINAQLSIPYGDRRRQ